MKKVKKTVIVTNCICFAVSPFLNGLKQLRWFNEKYS